MWSRRQFLRFTGAVSLIPLAGYVVPAISRMDDDAHFFVMLRVFGGLDVTLGLDPWLLEEKPNPTDMFVEYSRDELIAINDQIKVGPAAQPLVNHANQFSIVNGVFMNRLDNGHDAAFAYISAGTTSTLAPTLPVEIALGTRDSDFGVLTNSTLFLGNRTILTSSLNDLKELPASTDPSDILRRFTDVHHSPYFEAMRRVLTSQQALERFFQALQTFGSPENLTDLQVLAAVFMTDMARHAQFEIRANLDSHSSHPGNHTREQKKVWSAIDEMWTLFKSIPYGQNGRSLFDQTTFLVVSEFSRTPYLNGANGKDHNPLTNSVIFAGKGVRGGQVIGASRLVPAAQSPTGAYHIAYPIDFTTCQVQYQRTDQSKMIFPENIAQTAATIMNVNRERFRSIPPDTEPLNALIL